MPTRKPKSPKQYSRKQWPEWHKKKDDIKKATDAIKAAQRSLNRALRRLAEVLARPPGDGPSGKG